MIGERSSGRPRGRGRGDPQPRPAHRDHGRDRRLTKLEDILRPGAVQEARFRWQEAFWFLLIGLWLGFIVLDGATWLLLALVLSVRLPLVEANAVKNFLAVPTTVVAMLVFASQGTIDWTLGAALGVGSVLGGLLGARLVLLEQARRWIAGCWWW